MKQWMRGGNLVCRRGGWERWQEWWLLMAHDVRRNKTGQNNTADHLLYFIATSYTTKPPINHTATIFCLVEQQGVIWNRIQQFDFGFSFLFLSSKSNWAAVGCHEVQDNKWILDLLGKMQQPLLWCIKRLQYHYDSSWSIASYLICKCYIGRFFKTTNQLKIKLYATVKCNFNCSTTTLFTQQCDLRVLNYNIHPYFISILNQSFIHGEIKDQGSKWAQKP